MADANVDLFFNESLSDLLGEGEDGILTITLSAGTYEALVFTENDRRRIRRRMIRQLLQSDTFVIDCNCFAANISTEPTPAPTPNPTVNSPTPEPISSLSICQSNPSLSHIE